MATKIERGVCCPYHPDAIIIEDYRAGDQICSECGLVVGDRVIDVGTEWRTFKDGGKNDPCRVGATENPLLNGSDLSTQISHTNNELYRIKHTNRRPTVNSDRVLNYALSEISNMSHKINLPKCIIDRANILFKQVHDKKNLKGRSTDAISSACLYIACRQEGVPRTFKEICAVSKHSKKEIGRCFKLILKALETSVELITTGDFMARFCSNLGLPNKILTAATYIAKKAVDMHIVPGRSPISVAAAAIYMASQASEDRRTQKEIGDIAGVADVTIRQSYKLMYPYARSLFPQNFEFALPIEQLPSSSSPTSFGQHGNHSAMPVNNVHPSVHNSHPTPPVHQVHNSSALHQMQQSSRHQIHQSSGHQIHQSSRHQIHQPPSQQLLQSPSQQIHQPPNQQMHQSSGHQIHQTPAHQIHQSPGRQIHQSPGHQIHQSVGHQIHQSSAHQIQQPSAHHIQQPPAHQIHQTPAHQIHQSPAHQIHQSPGHQIQHSTGHQIHHSTGHQLHHSTGPQLHHSAGPQLQHSTGPQLQHSTGHQIHQSHNIHHPSPPVHHPSPPVHHHQSPVMYDGMRVHPIHSYQPSYASTSFHSTPVFDGPSNHFSHHWM